MKLSHILFALAFLLAIPALVGLADAWLYVFAGRTMIINKHAPSLRQCHVRESL